MTRKVSSPVWEGAVRNVPQGNARAAYFIRPHESLTLTSDKQPIAALRKSTPALSAGFPDHVWSLKEFLLRPVHPPRSHISALCAL